MKTRNAISPRCLIKKFSLFCYSRCSYSRVISKVLVANRGDSACSVIQVAKTLGIATVAVYSLQDVSSKHVRLADESFLLRGNSYLNAGELIEIAKASGANAIHPGIGFLSENGEFALEVEKNSLFFIGPSSKALKLLGNKFKAKELANSLGIPTIPLITELDVKTASSRLFPIVIKSHCGGGGKGIRICHTLEEMHVALAEAKAEAKSSYGNENIFMEKYISQAKHVEIQILSDKFGNVKCFPERECSIQISFQKVSLVAFLLKLTLAENIVNRRITFNIYVGRTAKETI
jgi:acetyl/propionyl-CoA carboxylase alpha subunit